MSLIAEFARTARTRPKQIALLTEKSQMSYGDLLDLVTLLDIELHGRGVRPGQTLVLDRARAEFCLAMALVLSLRGLSVAFTTAKQATEAELAFDRVITSTPRDDVDPERQIVIEQGWFSALGSYPPPDFERLGGGGRFITQSSGTTGRPKLVVGTEEERIGTLQYGAGYRGVSLAGRRFCSTLSPWTGWALSTNLATLLQGGSVLSLTAEADKLPAYIDLYRVDALATTPAVIGRLLEIPDAGQFLSSVRDIRIGGSLMSPEMTREFAEICEARIHIGYGTTEIGPILTSQIDPKAPPPAGFVGSPLRDDLDLRFFDEKGALLPDEASEGVLGIRFTDPARKRHYLADEEERDFILTGDILRRSDLGYFYVGRIKNIINFGGNKYALETVSAALETAFPGRRFVPLVVPDAKGLERLALFYTGESELDGGELRRVLEKDFVGITAIHLERLATLPVTATGKIDTEALHRRIAKV